MKEREELIKDDKFHGKLEVLIDTFFEILERQQKLTQELENFRAAFKEWNPSGQSENIKAALKTVDTLQVEQQAKLTRKRMEDVCVANSSRLKKTKKWAE